MQFWSWHSGYNAGHVQGLKVGHDSGYAQGYQAEIAAAQPPKIDVPVLSSSQPHECLTFNQKLATELIALGLVLTLSFLWKKWTDRREHLKVTKSGGKFIKKLKALESRLETIKTNDGHGEMDSGLDSIDELINKYESLKEDKAMLPEENRKLRRENMLFREESDSQHRAQGKDTVKSEQGRSEQNDPLRRPTGIQRGSSATWRPVGQYDSRLDVQRQPGQRRVVERLELLRPMGTVQGICKRVAQAKPRSEVTCSAEAGSSRAGKTQEEVENVEEDFDMVDDLFPVADSSVKES